MASASLSVCLAWRVIVPRPRAHVVSSDVRPSLVSIVQRRAWYCATAGRWVIVITAAAASAEN
jgi:hypothetical protein